MLEPNSARSTPRRTGQSPEQRSRALDVSTVVEITVSGYRRVRRGNHDRRALKGARARVRDVMKP